MPTPEATPRLVYEVARSGPVPIPRPNTELLEVPLSLGIGPDNLVLTISDPGHSLRSARSSTYEEWTAAEKLHLTWFARPAGRPNVVLLRWGGGLCDERARLDIDRVATGLTFHEGPHVGCDAIGVSWSVRLTFHGPVDYAALTLKFESWPYDRIKAGRVGILARSLSHSLGPPVLLRIRKGRLGDLYEGPMSDLFPDVGHRRRHRLRALDAVAVEFGGSYRVCVGPGRCRTALGRELFMFTNDGYALLASRLTVPARGLVWLRG